MPYDATKQEPARRCFHSLSDSADWNDKIYFWTQKEGETKGRMLAFRKTPRDPKESCKGCLTLAAT